MKEEESANQQKKRTANQTTLSQFSAIKKKGDIKCDANNDLEHKEEEVLTKQEIPRKGENNNDQVKEEGISHIIMKAQPNENVCTRNDVLDNDAKHAKGVKGKKLQRKLDKPYPLSYIKSYYEYGGGKNAKKNKHGSIYNLRIEPGDLIEKATFKNIRKFDRKPSRVQSPKQKFYFMANRSSICTTNSKFIKLFEKAHGDRKHFVDENMKGEKHTPTKLSSKKKSIKLIENAKAVILENKNNSSSLTKKNKKEKDHVVVDVHSNENENSISQEKEGSEVLQNQSSFSCYGSQFDDIDMHATNYYKSNFFTCDKNLEDFQLKNCEDDSKGLSKKPSFDGLNNHINISSNLIIKKSLRNRVKTAIYKSKRIFKGKNKEKIIIFLNKSYCIWENEKFNDHFYRTIYKKDEMNELEEIEIYIDDYKKSKLRKFIYRIFPQFSAKSILLYVSFVQWIVYIILLSVQVNTSISPSINALDVLGSNYPIKVFHEHEYYRLFTSLFLHANFNHICANTYIQLTVGFLLEYLYGTFLIFFIYIFTGVYGILLASFFSFCDATMESSTATSGIIGMFYSEILIMTNFNVDRIGISVNLLCFFLLLLYLKYSSSTPSLNILSHFFAFIGGLLIGIIIKFKQLKFFVKHPLLILFFCLFFFVISITIPATFVPLISKCGA